MQLRHLTKTLGHYEITQARAIDGDTIEAIVLLPFGGMHRCRFRLAGWWAPELFGRDHANAIQARDALQKFLNETVVHVFSRSERRDKYGRYIVSLWTTHRPVTPEEVLGLFALTEAEHKADHDWKKLHGGSQVQGEPLPSGGPVEPSDGTGRLLPAEGGEEFP